MPNTKIVSDGNNRLAMDLIERIANRLDMPSDAFFSAAASTGTHSLVIEDTAEIISIFAKISDHQARRRCIYYARKMVDRIVTDKSPPDSSNICQIRRYRNSKSHRYQLNIDSGVSIYWSASTMHIFPAAALSGPIARSEPGCSPQ